MCMSLPDAPFMVLSPTITPYACKFIYISVHLTKPTKFIYLSIDQENIYLMTKIIQYPLGSFRDLEFLLPDNLSHPTKIP